MPGNAPRTVCGVGDVALPEHFLDAGNVKATDLVIVVAVVRMKGGRDVLQIQPGLVQIDIPVDGVISWGRRNRLVDEDEGDGDG